MQSVFEYHFKALLRSLLQISKSYKLYFELGALFVFLTCRDFWYYHRSLLSFTYFNLNIFYLVKRKKCRYSVNYYVSNSSFFAKVKVCVVLGHCCRLIFLFHMYYIIILSVFTETRYLSIRFPQRSPQRSLFLRRHLVLHDFRHIIFSVKIFL